MREWILNPTRAPVTAAERDVDRLSEEKPRLGDRGSVGDAEEMFRKREKCLYRDAKQPMKRRIEAAKCAAPYLHPRLCATPFSSLQSEPSPACSITGRVRHTAETARGLEAIECWGFECEIQGNV